MSGAKEPIRTVFLGSPQFAVPSLQALADSDHIDLALVVTQPDRRAGRGRKLQSPAVKIAADEYDVPVIQPETLRDADAVRALRDAAPDVIVVVSYGEILRRDVLHLPPYGCLNVHPSLLPKYRGSIPIQAAILNGDSASGVSIIKLVRRMDAGPILFQEAIPLHRSETAGELSERLAEHAAKHMPLVVHEWVNGRLTAAEQDASLATYTREMRKSDAQIDWSWDAQYIERFVRAMNPWPRAWTEFQGQRLSVDRVTVVGQSSEKKLDQIGSLDLDQNQVRVRVGDGLVRLETVQPAGKKSMPALDWARGLQVAPNERMAKPAEARSPLIFKRHE